MKEKDSQKKGTGEVMNCTREGAPINEFLKSEIEKSYHKTDSKKIVFSSSEEDESYNFLLKKHKNRTIVAHLIFTAIYVAYILIVVFSGVLKLKMFAPVIWIMMVVGGIIWAGIPFLILRKPEKTISFSVISDEYFIKTQKNMGNGKLYEMKEVSDEGTFYFLSGKDTGEGIVIEKDKITTGEIADFEEVFQKQLLKSSIKKEKSKR